MKHYSKRSHAVRCMNIVALGLILSTLLSVPARGGVPLRSICRLKGQEDNTIHSMGLIVGLNGTGDGSKFLPSIRALATSMELMGYPVAVDGAELKDAKNVALVSVTATIPAAGARQGNRLNCQIASIGSAKSLAGGRLQLTPMLGPLPNDHRVYALASGAVTSDVDNPTTGHVHAGCRLEEDFSSAYAKDGKITLVLEENHAGFRVAQDVVEAINSSPLAIEDGGYPSQSPQLAKALDQVNIEVAIPNGHQDNLVAFVSQVLDVTLVSIETVPRVVVNQRSGSIVIDGDVEISPCTVTHRNILVKAGGGGDSSESFVPIDPEDPENPKLQSLVAALNSLHVPKDDMIDIIKGLKRTGNLHAQLIIE